MTILGVILDAPERALLWTDSEVYSDDGVPSQLSPKLTVDATACAVGAGAGHSGVLAAAERVVREMYEFDAMPDAAAKVLRTEGARSAVRLQEHRFNSFACQTFVTAGWSQGSGRMLAWELTGAAFFVPTLASRLAVPYVPEIESVRAFDARGILALANAQMMALRVRLPNATGGPLVLAELRPGQVQTWSIPNWFTAPPCAKLEANDDDTRHSADEYCRADADA